MTSASDVLASDDMSSGALLKTRFFRRILQTQFFRLILPDALSFKLNSLALELVQPESLWIVL